MQTLVLDECGCRRLYSTSVDVDACTRGLQRRYVRFAYHLVGASTFGFSFGLVSALAATLSALAASSMDRFKFYFIPK
jgi:hypothetical protein